MRYLLTICLILSSIGQLFAQDSSETSEAKRNLDCYKVYEYKAALKQNKKDQIYRYGTFAAYVGGVSAPLAPVAAIVLYPPAIAAMIIGASTPNEERTLDLSMQYTKRYKKLIKKARKIDRTLSDTEFLEIVENGFLDGTYCSRGANAVYSFKEAKKYILNQVRLRINPNAID